MILPHNNEIIILIRCFPLNKTMFLGVTRYLLGIFKIKKKDIFCGNEMFSKTEILYTVYLVLIRYFLVISRCFSPNEETFL